ncbi:hypothetical protein Tco_1291257 [Tanacetum coccineum]
MRGARERAYAIDGGLWCCGGGRRGVAAGGAVVVMMMMEVVMFAGGGGCGSRRGEKRRVAASGGGDRVDSVVRIIFGFGQKSPPEKFSGGGGQKIWERERE